MKQRIYITGCAKTGTTLVRRLFNAFELKVYNEDEMKLMDFIKSDYDVAKRTSLMPFSDIIPVGESYKMLKLAKVNGVVCVNVVRNRKDVLASSNNYVSPERYDYSMSMSRNPRFQQFLAYTIDYDRLMEEADEIQRELAIELGLTIKHKWSDYPHFVPSEGLDQQAVEEYPLRPIGRK
jgi:hypothetical protein